MKKIVDEYLVGIIAGILGVANMLVNIPEIISVGGTWGLVVRIVLWIAFLIAAFIQIFKPQRDLNEYRSHNGKLEIQSSPYPKQITINDVRKNQKWNQLSSSTGTLPALMMEIDDEEVKPIIHKYTFLFIDVTNNPRINTMDRVAKHVTAQLSFYDNDHETINEGGRWAFSKESDWYIGKEHKETKAVDLHCYDKQSLIVIFRNKEEEAFRLNESSYKNKELTNSGCKLKEDNYEVHLKVWADNAEEIHQWYKLKTLDFELTPIETPNWYMEIYDC